MGPGEHENEPLNKHRTGAICTIVWVAWGHKHMGAKGDTLCSDKFTEDFSAEEFRHFWVFPTNRNLHG
jgi:hypothetical protein